MEMVNIRIIQDGASPTELKQKGKMILLGLMALFPF